MSYSAEISRQNPACILFLVDQSSSMAKPFGAQPDKRKSEGVADAINRLLYTLCIRCAQGKDIREWFNVGVIGYGREVKSALGGSLEGRGLVRIGKIANHPLRKESRTKQVSDGAGGLVPQTVEFPIWFDPVADGMTPMGDALAMAGQWLSGYLQEHPNCFPPIVINLTDGAANPGQDPVGEAAKLRQLRSSDGEVLLFNIHISARTDPAIMFPSDDGSLPDDLAKQLFSMSSVLPETFVDVANSEGFSVTTSSRGFAFNADLVAVIQFLDIGTRITQRAKN